MHTANQSLWENVFLFQGVGTPVASKPVLHRLNQATELCVKKSRKEPIIFSLGGRRGLEAIWFKTWVQSYQDYSELWKIFWQISEDFEPSNFFWKSEKFSDTFFWCKLAGQISENFPQSILIGTLFENLRKFSEIWENTQNSENFFVVRIEPWC